MGHAVSPNCWPLGRRRTCSVNVELDEGTHLLLQDRAHSFRRPEMPQDPVGGRWPEGSFLRSTCKALRDPTGW